MATITEKLLRKRAGHNEGHLGTLEEISLHQEYIIKIDHIQNWCKHLKILLLQSNLISRIENLWKLKCLEYLNLALNNIERIENLEGCESLHKLDLTLNFIGDLKSIRNLKKNCNLKSLFLEGNPCCNYVGYREYVISMLPQLETLDNAIITRSEKILSADQALDLESKIEKQQNDYIENRNIQKQLAVLNEKTDYNDDDDKFDSDNAKKFWDKQTQHTPETRIEIAKQFMKLKKENVVYTSPKKEKRKYTLFTKDGRPLNVNEAKVKFSFEENEKENLFTLTVQVYKYLDTSLLDVDVQPWFVRVLINKKVLQIVLPEEVKTDQSKAQRSTFSKNLMITMPKLHPNKILFTKEPQVLETGFLDKEKYIKDIINHTNTNNRLRETLEIGSCKHVNLHKVCKSD